MDLEDAVVDSINLIYSLYIDLCYIERDDVVWPTVLPPGRPKQRHIIPPATRRLFLDLKLSDDVVSLIERLTFMRTERAWRYDIYPQATEFYSYQDEDMIKYARDPDTGSRDEPTLLEPNELILAIAKNRDGSNIILDMIEGTIRCHNFNSHPNFEDIGKSERLTYCPKPDDQFHYKNTQAIAAKEFLQEWLSNLRSLKWMPFNIGDQYIMVERSEPVGMFKEISSANPKLLDPEELKHQKLKRILQQTYGWPDEFKRDEWAKDCRRVCEAIERGYVPPPERPNEEFAAQNIASRNETDQQSWWSFFSQLF